MFPLLCVLKSIYCSSSPQLPPELFLSFLLPVLPASLSLVSLKSSIKMLFLSTLLIRSAFASILAAPPLGGLLCRSGKLWLRIQTRNAADPLNVRRQHGRLEIRKNFFTVRVTESWNQIPSKLKNIKTSKGFKDAYAKHRGCDTV